jgi:hypothetical protein
VLQGLPGSELGQPAPDSENRQDHDRYHPAAYRDYLDCRHIRANQPLGDRIHDFEQQHCQQHQANAKQVIGLIASHEGANPGESKR